MIDAGIQITLVLVGNYEGFKFVYDNELTGDCEFSWKENFVLQEFGGYDEFNIVNANQISNQTRFVVRKIKRMFSLSWL